MFPTGSSTLTVMANEIVAVLDIDLNSPSTTEGQAQAATSQVEAASAPSSVSVQTLGTVTEVESAASSAEVG